MARWQRTRNLDENNDLARIHSFAQCIYKELVRYLNRYETSWRYVEARINLTEPEPLYSEIIMDGILNYADEQLINNCVGLLIDHNAYTFSDEAVALIEIDIDRSEPLGSFGYSMSYLPRLDVRS